MRRARLLDVASTPERKRRVERLIAHIETVGGYVTLDEAAAVTGAAKGMSLDTVLADATRDYARLFEAEAMVPCQGAQRRVRVLGLL